MPQKISVFLPLSFSSKVQIRKHFAFLNRGGFSSSIFDLIEGTHGYLQKCTMNIVSLFDIIIKTILRKDYKVNWGHLRVSFIPGENFQKPEGAMFITKSCYDIGCNFDHFLLSYCFLQTDGKTKKPGHHWDLKQDNDRKICQSKETQKV